MSMFKTNVKLTVDEILSRVDEELIFERYLGITPNLRKLYKNPLRNDPSAGCNFYRSRSNQRLYFKDFSHGYHWDCFNIVQLVFNCSFVEALQRVAEDFKLDGNHAGVKYKAKQIEVEKPANFLIKKREFNKKDLDWWEQFYITKDLLDKFYVYAVDVAWIQREKQEPEIIYRHYNKRPCYAYYLGKGEIKLYFPHNQDPYPRFRHTNRKTLQGYYLLPEFGENLVWTKSYKDAIALYGIFGIPAIATQSEMILPDLLDFTELYNRFDNHYCLYDNDKAGKRATLKLIKRYEPIKPLLFPSTMKKDFTDNLKEIGIDNMKKLIDETKEKFR